MKANWKDHPIEGYARAARERGEDGHFEAPLISHIVANLWMGGCKDGVRLDDDFMTVVSLYPWEKYRLGPWTKRTEVKMYDSAEGIATDDLNRAVDAVVAGMNKGKTLVHCQAGLNRSGLVSAAALMRLGWEAETAIDILRQKRSPMVLCNSTFERQLLELALSKQR